jgi:hypothetical protein
VVLDPDGRDGYDDLGDDAFGSSSLRRSEHRRLERAALGLSRGRVPSVVSGPRGNRSVAFWLTAFLFAATMLGTTLPTPLYALYDTTTTWR